MSDVEPSASGPIDAPVVPVVVEPPWSIDRLVEALRAIITVMSGFRGEVQLLYNETHALEKADRKIVLTSISKLIKSFQVLFKAYEAEHGALNIKNSRLAANLLSFVPAMVALRTHMSVRDPAQLAEARMQMTFVVGENESSTVMERIGLEDQFRGALSSGRASR